MFETPYMLIAMVSTFSLAFALAWGGRNAVNAAAHLQKARGLKDRVDHLVAEALDREDLIAKLRKQATRPPAEPVMHLIENLEPVKIYHLFERDRSAPPHLRVVKTRYATTDVDEAMREKMRLGCQLTVAEGFRAPNGDLFYNPRIRKVGE